MSNLGGTTPATPETPFKGAKRFLPESEERDDSGNKKIKVSGTIHKKGGIFFEEDTQYGKLFRFGLLSHESGNCYYIHDRKMRMKMVPKRLIVQVVNLEDGDECLMLADDPLSPPTKVTIRKEGIVNKEMAFNTKVHITTNGCDNTALIQDLLFTEEQMENLTHAAKVVYMDWEYGASSSNSSSIKSPPEKLSSFAFDVKQNQMWKPSD